MHGLLVNYRKNPQCEDSNRQLMQYYCQAKLSALRMISQFGTYLDGSRGLEPIFDYSFGSQLVGKEVVQNGKEVKHAVLIDKIGQKLDSLRSAKFVICFDGFHNTSSLL